jgi:hypothetical protein
MALDSSKEFDVEVQPAAAAAASSTASGLGLYGGPYDELAKFEIDSKDQYGNTRVGNDDSSLLQLVALCNNPTATGRCTSGDSQSFTASAINLDNAASTTSGHYLVSWQISDFIPAAGTYSLSVISGGSNITGSPFDAYVGTGAANTTNSELYLRAQQGSNPANSPSSFDNIVADSAQTAVAGVQRKFYVQARDADNQNRDEKDEGVQFVMSAQWTRQGIHSSATLSVSSAIYNVGESINLDGSTPRIAGKSGQYEITYIAQTAGTYTVEMLLRGRHLTRSSPFQVIVQPGPGTLDRTIVTGLPCTDPDLCIAKLRRSAKINLRDAYDNAAIGTADDVQVSWCGVGLYQTESGNSYILADATAATANSVFDIYWTPPFPGNFKMSVKYKRPEAVIDSSTGLTVTTLTTHDTIAGFMDDPTQSSVPSGKEASDLGYVGYGMAIASSAKLDTAGPSAPSSGSGTPVVTWHKATTAYESCTAFCGSIGTSCDDTQWPILGGISQHFIKLSAAIANVNLPSASQFLTVPLSFQGPNFAPFFNFDTAKPAGSRHIVQASTLQSTCVNTGSPALSTQVAGAPPVASLGNGMFRLCPCSRSTATQHILAGEVTTFNFQLIDHLGNNFTSGGNLNDIAFDISTSQFSTVSDSLTFQPLSNPVSKT